MTDADKLMVDNFVEALKQVQQYAVLGLGTSGSALALSLKAVAVGMQSGVVIPGISVAIDPAAARAVLLVVCVLVGAMAYYCADTANSIAACLKDKPDLLFAASTFPSIATSRYPLVRYAATVLPLVLSLCAVLIPMWHQQAFSWLAFWGWFTFLFSAYSSLARELRKPIGAI